MHTFPQAMLCHKLQGPFYPDFLRGALIEVSRSAARNAAVRPLPEHKCRLEICPEVEL